MRTKLVINANPAMRLTKLEKAAELLDLALYSDRRGYIEFRPGRPRMVSGGDRRRAAQ